MIKNIILLLLVFNVANANNTDKVKLFLNNLYSHYINEDPSFSFSNEKADTIFAPKLLELIRLDQKLANGENGYIDYDPLCSCQDNGNFKLKDIKIKVSKDTVFANVAFSISITDITLLIKLTYQNKKWLIEDIVSKDGSLFNFLKTSLDENNPNSIYKNNKE